MKVCFYLPNAGSFQETEGGVQRITRIIQNELKLSGVQVFLCTTYSESNKDYYEKDLFILPNSIEDSSENKLALKNFLRQNDINIIINQTAYANASLNLMESLENNRLKIINVHHNCVRCLYDHYPFIFKSNRPKWMSRIIEIFCLWPVVKFFYLKLSKRQWKRAINQGDAFVLYFDSFVDELRDFYDIESPKIHVITNPAAFYSELKENLKINKNIVYIGRVVLNQKRIDKLLNLWKKLHTEFLDWSFDLVGDGAYMNEAKKFVSDNNLSRITFHGFKDPIEFWKKGDIFTLTSDFEGFGMVLIEAQALGVVPVVFNCFSAIEEVIDNGKSGLIIQNYDEHLMFDEIKALMENDNRIMQLKYNGLKMAEKFDKSKVSRKWIEIFEKVII